MKYLYPSTVYTNHKPTRYSCDKCKGSSNSNLHFYLNKGYFTQSEVDNMFIIFHTKTGDFCGPCLEELERTHASFALGLESVRGANNV